MEKYIHYGSTQFEPLKVGEIKNAFFTKPSGGFWASPVNAVYGWKEWNEDEHFKECTENNSFTFTLKPEAKILKINTVEDLEGLPKDNTLVELKLNDWCLLDFEKIKNELGYDAIEVMAGSGKGLYYALYGWDCDSILIMNSDIVVI